MEIGCINAKPEVFLCYVKMQPRVMIILNLSDIIVSFDYVKEEFNTECITVIDQRYDRICQKKRRHPYMDKIIHIIRFHVVSVCDTQMLEDAEI